MTNDYKKSRYRTIEFIIIVFSLEDLLGLLILHAVLIFLITQYICLYAVHAFKQTFFPESVVHPLGDRAQDTLVEQDKGSLEVQVVEDGL